LALLTGAIGGLIVVDRLTRRSFLIGSFSITATVVLILTVWSDIPAWALILLFAIFAGVLSLGALICLRWAPETKGVHLGVLDHAPGAKEARA
jgi:putative MFS transporter